MKTKHIFLIILAGILFNSCKQTYYDHRRSDKLDYCDWNMTVVQQAMAANAIYRPTYYDTEENRKYYGEKTYVETIEKNIALNKNVEKNRARLQKVASDLQSSFDERVSARTNFLLAFYHDLNTLSPKNFSDKYKKHCTRELLRYLNYAYKILNVEESRNYGWYVFGGYKNDSIHSIIYLNGLRNGIEKQCADFIESTDNSNVFSEKYHYYNKEDKWYQVKMGDNGVFLKVEGEGKHIAITCVVNPALNVWVKTYYDR